LPPALVDLARRVVEENRALGRRVATAESCTGGLVAAALTEIPGSSEVIDTFGSVSVAVAWAMAQGALKASDADVAVALTGIAGPAGGSERKPVGTVVFARADKDADPNEVIADTQKFDDN